MDFKEILSRNDVVAVVGFSDNHARPSNRVARYLYGNGYKVYGVNPKLEGTIVDEISCYAFVRDLPENADIINIFRRSEFVEGIINEIVELDYKPNVIWTQIGVISMEGKAMASEKGIEYIENKCIMVEHANILF